jgi:uncharacterized protein (DUF362 family)/Pyruvate/2-oxoacid:ferredoxin oxidoreductase delta subunit
MSRVSLYHCNSVGEIKPVLQKIISDLDEERIQRIFYHKKVLLKPNLCIDHPPEKGATTHPAVLEALVQTALDYGADLTIGDGAAVGIKGNVFQTTGVMDICRKYKIPFVDFNREEGRTVTIADAFAMHEANIAKTYFEMDSVVNLPVFKSNMLFWISGALKNMKGLLVGMEKHKPHYLGVAPCVADINKVLRQDLIIMDGFVGMMGDGPAAGKPAEARLLIGGLDPVAIDDLALKLMGMKSAKVPMIQYALKAGIGSVDYQTAGDPPDTFSLQFEKPMVARNRVKTFLLNSAAGFVFRGFGSRSKMSVDRDKCILCARCRDMCPFHAIDISGGEVVIDRSKCQFCLCCTEVCAREAISLKGLLVNKGRIWK